MGLGFAGLGLLEEGSGISARGYRFRGLGLRRYKFWDSEFN